MKRLFLVLGSLALVLMLVVVQQAGQANGAELAALAPSNAIGYGFNLADWDLALVQDIGFDWVKVFNPPASRLPLHVLIRLEADAADLRDLVAFRESVRAVVRAHGPYIEAYEIGNEANLDADYGWGAPPVAADYVRLLCEAYAVIKQEDPASVVVSAGLAPTGRVSGTWEGHAGHSGSYQDEREYLREFVADGGTKCADAVGYHPYGFGADYDAEPDRWSPVAEENCTNGFCFRGAETFHEVLQTSGGGSLPIWATEFGWIVRPPEHCLSDPGFSGREWQLVSEEAQAENLAGAFRYAAANWPWMEAMFVFNLNFNTSGFYPECEQMRYYGVEDRPAEQALRGMSKVLAGAELVVDPPALTSMAPVAAQPFSQSFAVSVQNRGWEALSYSAYVLDGGTLTPLLRGDRGTLAPLVQAPIDITISSSGRAAGRYEAVVQVEAEGAFGSPARVPVSLYLVESMWQVHLPLVAR